MDITGLGSVADFAGTLVKKFFPDKMGDAEKAQAQIQLQRLLEKRESSIADAQKAIIVAEMNQSDNYTKRARPTLVYAGLFFIFLVHVLFPILAFYTSEEVPKQLTLPETFWWAWSGVCGVWIVGRSAEKCGKGGGVVSKITGSL